MADLQDALADVAFRLESLKAALNDQQPGEPSQAANLVARVAADLQSLLQPSQQAQPAASQGETAAQQQQQGPSQQAAPAAEGSMPQAGALPATPFDQRRPPAAGPSTAAKAAAPTPRGLPATTPLAAEVLASLNGLPPADAEGSGHGSAAVAETDGDAEAAATLSGFLGGGLSLEPPSRAGSGPRQQHNRTSPALASILGDTALLPPPPMHAAAMAAAAAAAAGPAVPVSRRGSAASAALPIATQARNLRPCNCKRSMCLKMYCDCFAAGGYCAPSCTCLSCSNTPAEFEAVQAAREIVLAKNPRAFEVKVTASEGHKRGCRCKRSKCLKKYCECFHAGARCNPDVCQCEDCRNTDGDTMLAPLLGLGAQAGPSWAGMGLLDPTADVLAMFQGPLPPLPTASNGSGSSGDSANRRAQAAAAAIPLPPLPAFVLPPLPDASSLLGSLPLPALDPAAAAAFAIHPAAAAATATFAAAATMADTQQQQQAEESMADAASCPAAMQAAAAALAAATAAGGAPPAALAGPAAATPVGQAKVVASALTSHLSDMAGPDAEMHDTATSPAPHMAIAQLAGRRDLAAAVAATLTGGAPAVVLKGRPPLPNGRVRSRAQSPDLSSADENGGDSSLSQRSKRPRRAASGGVLGAVAAEASEWGLEMVSPPLKRANSLPAAAEAVPPKAGRPKVSDRVALLKKALAGETAAAAATTAGMLPVGRPAVLCEADLDEAPSAEDEDAVSALFELSASVC